MRLWSVLILSSSLLALSACSSLGLKGADKPGEKTGTVAAAKATPADSEAAAQEQRELSATSSDAAASQTAALPPELAPPADIAIKANIPDKCPGIEVLPDTKSITYFEGDHIGSAITARAQLVDIKGGCDYSKDSVIVDLDMIMKGHITDKGRYDGRKDLEAFMTFPYFVAVMDPDGKLIDKKIMATAMRFQPSIDDLDHAEKITQTIPLKDVSLGSKYTITLGFQLNRQQLDYNRGVVSAIPAVTPASIPEEKPAAEAKPAPKAKEKAEAPAKAQEPAADTTTTSIAAPAPVKSSDAKMKPIVD